MVKLDQLFDRNGGQVSTGWDDSNRAIRFEEEAGMLSGVENEERYLSDFEKIKEASCRQAFVYLVGCAAVMRDFRCCPGRHGAVKDFRYYKGREHLFAFVTNEEWLLFYFRNPALKRSKFSREAVLAHFPEAKENTAGEVTIKIQDLEQAIRLNTLIAS